jgi:hypothetical protein
MPPSPDQTGPPAGPPFEAYAGPEPFIFVSYAHEDNAVVYPEITRLHQAGYRVWYDEGIDAGSDWPDEIAKALDRCSFFLVFISPKSVESQNVRNEINYAINHHKPIIAVHLEETVLSKGLELRMGDIQAVLKYRLPPEQYQRRLERALPAQLLAPAGAAGEVRGQPEAGKEARPAEPPAPAGGGTIPLPRFHYGSVVPPDYYIDRERELLEAQQIIDAGQSFLLVGDRRAGKTSFCKKLIHQLMGRPDNTVLASYLNLQQCPELKIETFLQETIINMIGEIARQVFRCKYMDLMRRNPAEANPALQGDPSFETFVSIFRLARKRTQARGGTGHYLEAHDFVRFVTDLLDLLRAKGWGPFVIFYDEANRLPGAFPVEMLTSNMEALALAGVVSVFAASPEMAESFTPLEDLCFQQVHIGPFPRFEDMQRLLARYCFGDVSLTGDLPITGEALALLWKLTGGKPFLIQLIAGYSFRQAVDRREPVVSAAHVAAAADIVRAQKPEAFEDRKKGPSAR